VEKIVIASVHFELLKRSIALPHLCCSRWLAICLDCWPSRCGRQVMKESSGRANPGELNRRLMETLNAKQ